jgi:hypothetical protein
MPKFKVSVEKRLYCTGSIEVEAESASSAIDDVQGQIHSGTLQTTTVEWNDPEYEDCSFSTTGDVD